MLRRQRYMLGVAASALLAYMALNNAGQFASAVRLHPRERRRVDHVRDALLRHAEERPNALPHEQPAIELQFEPDDLLGLDEGNEVAVLEANDAHAAMHDGTAELHASKHAAEQLLAQDQPAGQEQELGDEVTAAQEEPQKLNMQAHQSSQDGAVQLQTGVVYNAPAYSHMVAHPHDVFAEPARGAWVYFVGVNADRRHYLHWALASVQCLQNTSTKWDIVVFFEGSDLSAADALRGLGVRVLLMHEYIASLSVDLSEFHKKNEESDTSNGWYHAWNKLLAWTLTEYEKLVLVDSDTLAWTNADELFAFPQFAAVQDSVWPLMSDEYQQYFNTGVMVIEPSVDTFNALIAGLDGWNRPWPFWWDVSEQTYLNMFFNTSWYHLPMSYNFVSFLFAGAVAVDWNVQHVKLVHHLRDSQFDVTYELTDCVKHYCPRCCEKLVQCKSAAMSRVGLEHHRPERTDTAEDADEEHLRFMARLGLA